VNKFQFNHISIIAVLRFVLLFMAGLPRVLKSPEFGFFNNPDLRSPEIGHWCWK